MSNAVDNMVKTITKAIDNSHNKKTAKYETMAEVTHVDGDTVWVHIPGGVQETPVKKTINAKKGDTVKVSISKTGSAIIGNTTAPPTDDTKANHATNIAVEAQNTADTAEQQAESAKIAADTAWGYADDAYVAAQAASASAGHAQMSADAAYTSAQNANEYAVRAYANLGAVENVVETLEWITKHGTMTNTQDLTPILTSLDPAQVYFIEDENGEYEVGNVRYSLVKEPKSEDISSYYILTIDESLNNYVATHLALTGEGLKIVNVDDTSYHMLITPNDVQIKNNIGTPVATYGSSITLGAGNVVTTITNQDMICNNIYFTYLYPIGTGLVLEARTNGHFSIKPYSSN